MAGFNHLRTFMLLAAMTALFMVVGWLVGGMTGALIALAVAFGLNVFAYWNSDKIALRQYRARPASDFGSDPRIRAFEQDVTAMAARAGLPTPQIYIADIPQPNAFATGRNPENAAVVATTGLLSMLSRDEIAGVMAHELAHVKSRDTLTMTVTATIAGAISTLANFAFFFGGGGDRERPLGGFGLILVMLLAPIAAALVQFAISRTREYEADRIGAEIAGDPRALASALEKIAMGTKRIANAPAEQSPATAHMFIMNPLHGRGADNLFSTHPDTANRIARLETLAREMGAGRARASSVPEVGGPWDRRGGGPWG